MRIDITVNGTPESHDVEARTLLVYYLRDAVGLKGTNVGCDTTSCGACTVLLNGQSVKSCTVLAAQVAGDEVTTIEGMALEDGRMHPVQQAFQECHGLQCGYCTPGMIMNAYALLLKTPHPTREQIARHMEDNLCRCGSHGRILDAIQEAGGAVKS